MSDLLERKFIVVAGKGGVGRTTVSMILGLCAAARDLRTLVCLSSAPPRYSELLGGVSLGPEPHRAAENLFVANLDPVSAREEYGLKILRNRTLHRLVFESRVVNGFLDAVPGLAEWAMLGKATFHALNVVGGRPEYDLVVFDSPATGHGLDLLSLPGVIASTVPAGRIREEALLRVALMEDPRRCEVVPVTLAEEMPANEAVELVRALEGRSLSVRRIVVNMLTPPEGEEPGAAEGLDPEADWALPARMELDRLRVQRRCLARLKNELNLPIMGLPRIPGRLHEASAIRLARHLDAQL